MGKFTDIFKDSNDINEKSVLGFLSFTIMILAFLVDVISGALGHNIEISSSIYDSFVLTTLGSFGIGTVEKGMDLYRKKK